MSKLLILLVNFVLLRLAVAGTSELEGDLKESQKLEPSVELSQKEKVQNAWINGSQTLSSHELSNQPEEFELKFQEAKLKKSAEETNGTRSSGKRRAKSNGSNQTSSVIKMISSLIDQIDRLDLKRLLVESLNQLQQPRLAELILPSVAKRRPGLRDTKSTNETLKTAKVNGSAIAAESGNLLSITRQLVKLARNGFTGSEFGSNPLLGAHSANWLGPLIAMPTMLSAAATHAMHAADQSAEFGHHHLASSKSDWFWVIMPAIIAVGAGVIIVPLIAAWLVSGAMSQNTLTVAAGKRRRRRDTRGLGQDPLALELTHSDVFKLLDLHAWLDDLAPDLFVSKLSRLHEALESIGSGLVNSKILQAKEAHRRAP